MRVLLDSNVWRYLTDHDPSRTFEECVDENHIEIVVAPALVFEGRDLEDDAVRKRILRRIAQKRWTRLMPDAFLEAEEIKYFVRRRRPGWLTRTPDLSEVTRLRRDWEGSDDGFWARALDDVAPPVTDESERADREKELARVEAKAIRQRVHARKQTLPKVRFGDVAGVLPEGTPGWHGDPVEYWRVPFLFHLFAELKIWTSPYREWLDSEIDVAAIEREPESLTQLICYELAADEAPRQWLRGAYEYLQAFHKVTEGNPADSQLAGHLVDADIVILSPPASVGTRSTGVTGTKGPTRWRADGSSPPPRGDRQSGHGVVSPAASRERRVVPLGTALAVMISQLPDAVQCDRTVPPSPPIERWPRSQRPI